jgi:hypothetical protein
MNSIGLFFSLGGNEILNQARTRTYMENGIRPAQMDLLECCEPCPGLADILGDASYQLPDTDPAPWYDPQFRESADFAGLVVEEVTLSSPVRDRPFTQNVGHGATLGRIRYSGRTLVVTGWLAGRTCCAVAYGLRWLQHALMPACVTQQACGGDEACFLTCCPSNDNPAGALSVCVDDAELCDDYEGDPIFDYECRDGEPSEWLRGGDFWRHAFNVGLVDGPRVIEQIGIKGDCGCTEVVRVEFTIGVGTPWLFDEPTPCIEDAVAFECSPGPCLRPSEIEPCPEFVGCLEDPLCPPPPRPPAIPVPANPCVCIPQNTSRITCEIPAPAGGDWFDATTIVHVVAPHEPLRNLAIRMWQNPLGFKPWELDDCLACSTAFISYVPAGGELILDGRTRRNTITCGNTTQDASPNLFTLEGLPFQPLDLGCDPAVIAIDFACGTPPDARVSIDVVRRSLW